MRKNESNIPTAWEKMSQKFPRMGKNEPKVPTHGERKFSLDKQIKLKILLSISISQYIHYYA